MIPAIPMSNSAVIIRPISDCRSAASIIRSLRGRLKQWASTSIAVSSVIVGSVASIRGDTSRPLCPEVLALFQASQEVQTVGMETHHNIIRARAIHRVEGNGSNPSVIRDLHGPLKPTLSLRDTRVDRAIQQLKPNNRRHLIATCTFPEVSAVNCFSILPS